MGGSGASERMDLMIFEAARFAGVTQPLSTSSDQASLADFGRNSRWQFRQALRRRLR